MTSHQLPHEFVSFRNGIAVARKEQAMCAALPTHYDHWAATLFDLEQARKKSRKAFGMYVRPGLKPETRQKHEASYRELSNKLGELATVLLQARGALESDYAQHCANQAQAIETL
ncbi:hypothetical protein VSR68_37885 [Paraburkholderia phymatum]|uniref:hypothetical protein n=1 Tax=Paraburkholderia phymatum TaxID=148447 RepID=UPI00317F6E76